MESRTYVDGNITSIGDARASVLDRGFLYSVSVYEVFWVHKGVLIQEDEHFARLEASATALYMPLRRSRDELRAAIRATCIAAAATERDEIYVRLVITAGQEPLDTRHSGRGQSIVIIVREANRPTDSELSHGIRAAIVRRPTVAEYGHGPGVKTGNYVNHIVALAEAKQRGADEALMLNSDGDVTEATTANVYLVSRGTVATPALSAGLLRGTTRRRILDLCKRAGVSIAERRVLPSELLEAEEIFVSSAVRGIIPVTAIEDKMVGNGTLGAVTGRIRKLFEDAADEEAAKGERLL